MIDISAPIRGTRVRRRLAGVAMLVLSPLAAQAATPVTVTAAWFRYLLPQIPAGGYMTLHNPGPRPATLTNAASPACGMMMLHRSVNRNGTDMMLPVDHISIPPGGTLRFAPGGYHLMCMAPVMKPGDTVTVTLHFTGDAPVTVPFAVRSATGK